MPRNGRTWLWDYIRLDAEPLGGVQEETELAIRLSLDGMQVQNFPSSFHGFANPPPVDGVYVVTSAYELDLRLPSVGTRDQIPILRGVRGYPEFAVLRRQHPELSFALRDTG